MECAIHLQWIAVRRLHHVLSCVNTREHTGESRADAEAGGQPGEHPACAPLMRRLFNTLPLAGVGVNAPTPDEPARRRGPPGFSALGTLGGRGLCDQGLEVDAVLDTRLRDARGPGEDPHMRARRIVPLE